MTVSVFVHRRAGHPWDGRPGFDLLEVKAETQAELDRVVAKATARFWQPWLIGRDESDDLPAGVLYKPSGALAPWHDSPEHPHPGSDD